MKIKKRILDQIGRHALDSRPQECCGILLASPDEPGVVSRVLPAANEAPAWRERRYVLGRKAHLKAIKMEASGEAVIVGYYHSHVWGAAWPSSSDLAEAVPGPLYLIAAVNRRAIQYLAWTVDGEEVVFEPVDLVRDDRVAGTQGIAYVH